MGQNAASFTRIGGCPTEYRIAADQPQLTGKVVFDGPGVDTIRQHLPLVIIGAQPQFLLLVSHHPPVSHTEADVCRQVFAAMKHQFETPPRDCVLHF